LQSLTKSDFKIASPLLSHLNHHTVLKAILVGDIPGKIYCDDPALPQVVFAQFKHRTFLAGDPSRMEIKALDEFIESTVLQNCRDWDVPLFRLAVEPQAWMEKIARSLAARQPIEATYQCYQYQMAELLPETVIPLGFSLQEVTQDLIDSDFGGKKDLLEEMCSERESINAFLEKSFGIAAFKDQNLAGWCLSEYNFGTQCEVGIAVMPPFRKQGLANCMTKTFIHQAANKGFERILWHCDQSNEPSWRTALSAGFELLLSEPVRIVYPDQSLNAAVHGNIYFEDKKYQAALNWYKKALALPGRQAWMAWNGACAAAHCGRSDLAFELLHHAVDLGFSDLEHLVESPHLGALKQDPRWGELITRINHAIHT
jgi:tetratricopeptide (TPR) repeat protein